MVIQVNGVLPGRFDHGLVTVGNRVLLIGGHGAATASSDDKPLDVFSLDVSESCPTGEWCK